MPAYDRIQGFFRMGLMWIALGACGLESDAGNAPILNSPAALEILGGDKQMARVGTTLPAPIIVRVRDSRQEPILGLSISFHVTVGEGRVSSASVKTDTEGIAQVEWTLGDEAGAQEIEARVADPRSGQATLTAKITATATES